MSRRHCSRRRPGTLGWATGTKLDLCLAKMKTAVVRRALLRLLVRTADDVWKHAQYIPAEKLRLGGPGGSTDGFFAKAKKIMVHGGGGRDSNCFAERELWPGSALLKVRCALAIRGVKRWFF